MTRDDAYVAGRAGSAAILADAYGAAEQLYQDVLDGAHAKAMGSRRTLADMAERDRAHGNAGDARAYMYQEAEERHQDRLAALAQHFGQFYGGQGNPAADHARAFVETLDPAGEHKVAAPEPTPIRRIEFGGVTREAGAILSPSGAPSLIPFDRSNSRETFTGDTAAFNRLKFAGTRTPSERADDERGSSVVRAKLVPDDRQSTDRCEPPPAYPTVAEPKQAIPAPPAGLLADIAATLARTKGVL